MDISLVGNRFDQNMLTFPRYYFSSLFLRLSRWLIMALVDTSYCNHNILASQNYKGEVK